MLAAGGKAEASSDVFKVVEESNSAPPRVFVCLPEEESSTWRRSSSSVCGPAINHLARKNIYRLSQRFVSCGRKKNSAAHLGPREHFAGNHFGMGNGLVVRHRRLMLGLVCLRNKRMSE